ncbi:N-formylglutamate amidohydrolase [Bartonella sp. DGB2]|uniref:N-formylglutamate amidohydrolase n=1 Tax=Bartonella sp. DGB2 TaxID=3388426 RepID=UPI0039900AB0
MITPPLDPDSPFTILKGDLKKGLLLIADHASPYIPSSYSNLGLPPKVLTSHRAYDIGIAALTVMLSTQLKAPAILSGFSRLLIDPNRGLDDPTLIMQISDGAIIRGNYPISENERNQRINTFYRPYDEAIAQTLQRIEVASHKSPLTISLHSFTPQWRGIARPWHIGLLYHKDKRAFTPLYQTLNAIDSLIIGKNQPYDGALSGSTLDRHCGRFGRPHILIEIRQDLLATQSAINAWSRRLAPIFNALNQMPNLHEKQNF